MYLLPTNAYRNKTPTNQKIQICDNNMKPQPHYPYDFAFSLKLTTLVKVYLKNAKTKITQQHMEVNCRLTHLTFTIV